MPGFFVAFNFLYALGFHLILCLNSLLIAVTLLNGHPWFTWYVPVSVVCWWRGVEGDHPSLADEVEALMDGHWLHDMTLTTYYMDASHCTRTPGTAPRGSPTDTLVKLMLFLFAFFLFLLLSMLVSNCELTMPFTPWLTRWSLPDLTNYLWITEWVDVIYVLVMDILFVNLGLQWLRSTRGCWRCPISLSAQSHWVCGQ